MKLNEIQNKSVPILKSILILVILLSLGSCDYSDDDQLFVSSGEGDVTRVKALLAKGADVNHRFQHLQRDFQPYETALMNAAEHGHLKVVKVLVKAKADLEMQNTYTSETALYKAIKNKHVKVYKYLLKKKADPQIEETFGKTTLMIGIERNNLKLIKLLVKYGAWPDSTKKDGALIKGTVGKNAVALAKALKRPYVGYLKSVIKRCRRLLKTQIHCRAK